MRTWVRTIVNKTVDPNDNVDLDHNPLDDFIHTNVAGTAR